MKPLLLGMALLGGISSGGAVLVPSPAQVDFGDQATGATSDPMPTTFRNTGNQAVTVTAVSAVTLAAFVRAGGTCGEPPFTVAPQASCTIEHTFTPYLVQAYCGYAHLTLAGGGRVDFGLAGEGNVAYLDIWPPSLSYFPVDVGTSSEGQTINLSNLRPVGMTVSHMYLDGPDASAFVRTGGTCPTQVPFYWGASSSCTLTYRFVPDHVGSHSASMNILGSGSFGFSLSGDGAPETPLFGDGFEAVAPTP
ncbi:choice-of-anchor D domain-containing protein [Tahibacter harae]|uniref:Choice-of-anchor D domain-containing protein n=1 Tax=Tahibacter harae TaxID=2963937 RepID=A0ABT1QV44_9GAMM|nr:choice-of-anchor D domain-containing protein [Tahibacter harae]MCQ4166162.1 choice-of-anchor D domain-containing protein [Tahibacter harae]